MSTGSNLKKKKSWESKRQFENEIRRIEKYGFKSVGLNKIGHKLLDNCLKLTEYKMKEKERFAVAAANAVAATSATHTQMACKTN